MYRLKVVLLVLFPFMSFAMDHHQNEVALVEGHKIKINQKIYDLTQEADRNDLLFLIEEMVEKIESQSQGEQLKKIGKFLLNSLLIMKTVNFGSISHIGSPFTKVGMGALVLYPFEKDLPTALSFNDVIEKGQNIKKHIRAYDIEKVLEIDGVFELINEFYKEQNDGLNREISKGTSRQMRLFLLSFCMLCFGCYEEYCLGNINNIYFIPLLLGLFAGNILLV